MRQISDEGNVYPVYTKSVNVYADKQVTSSGLVFDDKERVGAWVAKLTGQDAPWGSYYAMGAEVRGKLVAGIVINNFNACNATSHIAVSKPTKLFSELLDHCFVYAFRQCGLKRLTGFIEADNEKSLRVSRHIGFQDEAVLRGAGSDGQDMIVLVLWPSNYRRGKRNG